MVKGYITCDKFRVRTRLRTCVTHVPLQVFGDMLTRRTKTRIQSREEKRNCLMSVWWFCSFISLCACLQYNMFYSCTLYTIWIICVCARAGALIYGLPTFVRSHFWGISYCPEISGLQSCDGGGSGLSNKQYPKSIFLWFASCNIAQYTRTRT